MQNGTTPGAPKNRTNSGTKIPGTNIQGKNGAGRTAGTPYTGNPRTAPQSGGRTGTRPTQQAGNASVRNGQSRRSTPVAGVRAGTHRVPVRTPAIGSDRNYSGQKRKKQKNAVTGIASLLIIMIFVSSVLLAVRNIDWAAINLDRDHAPFANPDKELYGPDVTPEERDAYLTRYVTVSAEDVYRGHCILVNLEHEYHFPSEEETDETVLSVYKNKTKSYKVNSGSMRLHIDMINALNAMMDDFYEETGSRDVMVNSAYRSYDGQQNTYDYYVRERGAQYAEDYVQKPGFSEHHTGFACDFAVYQEYDDETSAMWAFDGKDQYFWIDRNCAQYGLILRYSASKEKITGISYESWHYRYVGVGNALAVSNLGLALEEYAIAVKNYAYDGCEYYITGADGKEYAIYYVPWNGQETQEIPIPSTALEYEISGNNFDGFIVSAVIGTGNALK